jgi:hypothetical protein
MNISEDRPKSPREHFSFKKDMLVKKEPDFSLFFFLQYHRIINPLFFGSFWRYRD